VRSRLRTAGIALKLTLAQCAGPTKLSPKCQKKLKGFKNKYRLRAGNYRALFELEGTCLVVYDVGDRKDIYE